MSSSTVDLHALVVPLRRPVVRDQCAPRVHVQVHSPSVVVRAGLEAVLRDLSQGVGSQRHGRRDPRGVDPCPVVGVAFVDSVCFQGSLDRGLVRALSSPSHVVVVVARPDDPALTDRALDLGSDGALSVQSSSADVEGALRAARSRRLGPLRASPGSDYRLNPFPAPMDAVARSLSPRELEVLSWVARGRSTKEIAEELVVSDNTVKTYLRTGYRKIGVTSRTGATLWGLQSRVSDMQRRARLLVA